MKNLLLLCLVASVLFAAERPGHFDYRLLATNKTSTMEREMNEAAASGYSFATVMGGETGFGGKEVVVVMAKSDSEAVNPRRRYKLLATNKTSTMEKELQRAGRDGFEYKGQTVFESAFGGREVSVILELTDKRSQAWSYRLLATSKTSTMESELNEAGASGYSLLGMTVGKTAFGGNEVLSILGKPE